MIHYSSHLSPSPSQLKVAKKFATGTFNAVAPPEFDMVNIPTYNQLEPVSSILLKCKHVAPHTDDWFGDGDIPDSDRLAVFWLLYGNLTIQCGNSIKNMSSGDYVIFNDSMAHSVHAYNQWIGCVYQLQRK